MKSISFCNRGKAGGCFRAIPRWKRETRVPIALMPESSAEESALNSGFFRCDKLEMEEGEISVRALCLPFHSASGQPDTWAGDGGVIDASR